MGCGQGIHTTETQLFPVKVPDCPQEPDHAGSESTRTVLGRFAMGLLEEDILGEGTFSVCRRATDLTTGRAVAIKTCKRRRGATAGERKEIFTRFSRQIEVLQLLQAPLEEPQDARLWCQRLARAEPAQLFIQLLDYSKDAAGNPGPDPADGEMYVVTELAQYSLRDMLHHRRKQNLPLSGDELRASARAILLVVAALHAKGLVHLDLKPANLMVFGGRLKLIDVDGCVPCGSEVSIGDTHISYTRIYCAPEWAGFIIDSDQSSIVADWRLDVWSVGMTIAELATLTPVLEEKYAKMLRKHSREEASFRFFHWLSRLGSVDLPDFEDRLASLLTDCLLAPVPGHRRSLAQCLSHPLFQ